MTSCDLCGETVKGQTFTLRYDSAWWDVCELCYDEYYAEPCRWEWPDWVPTRIQRTIENLWPDDGRYQYTKSKWMLDATAHNMPEIGTRVRIVRRPCDGGGYVVGRYVHMIHNFGLVVDDDGDVYTCGWSSDLGEPEGWELN